MFSSFLYWYHDVAPVAECKGKEQFVEETTSCQTNCEKVTKTQTFPGFFLGELLRMKFDKNEIRNVENWTSQSTFCSTYTSLFRRWKNTYQIKRGCYWKWKLVHWEWCGEKDWLCRAGSVLYKDDMKGDSFHGMNRQYWKDKWRYCVYTYKNNRYCIIECVILI